MKSKFSLVLCIVFSIFSFSYIFAKPIKKLDLKLEIGISLDYYAVNEDRTINVLFAESLADNTYIEFDDSIQEINNKFNNIKKNLSTEYNIQNLHDLILLQRDRLELKVLIIPRVYRELKQKTVLHSLPWESFGLIDNISYVLSHIPNRGFMIHGIPKSNVEYLLFEYCPCRGEIIRDGTFILNSPTNLSLVFEGVPNKDYLLIELKNLLSEINPKEEFISSVKFVPKKIVETQVLMDWNWQHLGDGKITKQKVLHELSQNSLIGNHDHVIGVDNSK
jgi:hypothetical protein